MRISRAISLLLVVVAPALLVQSCAIPKAKDGGRGIPSPAALDRQALQATTPDGRLTALGDNGLMLTERMSGKTLRLSPQTPVALAWRRDGARLAAGFVDGQEESHLVVFDRDGHRLEEHPLPGRSLVVTWSSRNDLLVAGYRLREYSFGANLVQWLVRIDGRNREQIGLGDTTLTPGTAKRLQASLPELLALAFSPAGDELAYLRLYDPPQFPPYLRLLYRNWQVPTDRKLLDLPVHPASIEWLPPDDVLACRSGDNDVQRLELWPAADASRRAEGAGSAELPPAAEHDRLWALRKWRFEGLITPDEFRTTVKGMHP